MATIREEVTRLVPGSVVDVRMGGVAQVFLKGAARSRFV
jgi:hypothetical protein